MPSDPAGVVRALRACRETMIGVSRQVKPSGPCYHAASMVIAAIDGMAAFLTRERHYFHAEGSTSSDDFRQQVDERMAREQGEKPWEGDYS